MEDLIKWVTGSWATIIIGIAAIIGAIVGIIKGVTFLRKWFLKKIQYMVGLEEIIEKQARMEAKIDKVLGELTHNGGTSTKDVVKAVSESMIRLESRQQAMLDSLHYEQGMFECTQNGEFIWLNKKLCYLLGKTKEDMLGMGWINSVGLEYREAVRNEFEECLEQQREFLFDFVMVKSNYNDIKVTMKTTKMTDHRGKLIGYFGTITHLEDEDDE